MREFLDGVEELRKAEREARDSALWDEKMKATQSESAFGVRCV